MLRPGDRPLSRRELLQTAAGAAAGVGVLSLAACGGSKNSSDGASPATTTPSGSTQAAASSANRGGIMQISFSSASVKDKLDPATPTSTLETVIAGMLYQSLTGVDDDWNATPQLAERWEPNGELTQWTFFLRGDVKFHDGRPLTAKDVAFSIRRVLDKATGSPLYARLTSSVKPGGVEVVDDRTLRLHLKEPDVFIPLAMSERFVHVVPNGTTDFGKGIGTGAFRFKSFRPGESFEVERNPEYWESGKPHLDGVQGLVVPEQGTKLQSVLSGNADFCDDIDFTSVSQVEANPEAQVLQLKNNRYLDVVLAADTPPFDDNRVRMAIKLAVDREKILKIAYASLGTVGNDCPVVPDDPFVPDALGTREQNIPEAKRLLAEAGHAGGIDLTLLTSDAVAGGNDLAVAFKEVVAGAGIRVDIKVTPGDAYFDQVFLKAPMYVDYWTRRHPNEALSIAFTSDAVWNESKTFDTHLDELVADARRTTDLAKQKEAYGEALTWISNNSGFVLPAWIDQTYAAKKRVQGIRFTFPPLIDLTNVTLAA